MKVYCNILIVLFVCYSQGSANDGQDIKDDEKLVALVVQLLRLVSYRQRLSKYYL